MNDTTKHSRALRHFSLKRALAFYNSTMSTNPYDCRSGLAATIVHEDGPVAYASRALTDAEKNYAQEMLAIVFGCINFHIPVYFLSTLFWTLTTNPLKQHLTSHRTRHLRDNSACYVAFRNMTYMLLTRFPEHISWKQTQKITWS